MNLTFVTVKLVVLLFAFLAMFVFTMVLLASQNSKKIRIISASVSACLLIGYIFSFMYIGLPVSKIGINKVLNSAVVSQYDRGANDAKLKVKSGHIMSSWTKVNDDSDSGLPNIQIEMCKFKNDEQSDDYYKSEIGRWKQDAPKHLKHAIRQTAQNGFDVSLMPIEIEDKGKFLPFYLDYHSQVYIIKDNYVIHIEERSDKKFNTKTIIKNIVKNFEPDYMMSHDINEDGRSLNTNDCVQIETAK